ncbi:MAG: rhodanese-like domain-containing protein [Solirubrobacteraceae bacterium]
MAHTASLDRTPRRDITCMVPRALGHGLFKVDGTWGTVQAIELAPGVHTIGELELIAHLEQGLALIDTRLPHFHRQATIPGARGIPHQQILDRRDELDPSAPTAFFCNGPQCKATPDAIGALLDAGCPPEAILYYRGGMHDWMTLGYPTVSGPVEAGPRD